jgi:hypothetical protein
MINPFGTQCGGFWRKKSDIWSHSESLSLKQLLKFVPRSGEARSHGSDGYSEGIRRLLVTQSVPEDKDHHFHLAIGKCRPDFRPVNRRSSRQSVYDFVF